MTRKYITEIALQSLSDSDERCSFAVTFTDGSTAVLQGEYECMPIGEASECTNPFGASNEDWSCDVCIYDAPAIAAHDLQTMSRLALDAYMLTDAQGTRTLVMVDSYEPHDDSFGIVIDGQHSTVAGNVLPFVIGECGEPSELVGKIFARKLP